MGGAEGGGTPQRWKPQNLYISITEVFGSTGFGNSGFLEVTDILAMPKFKFYIKNVQSNGFPGITDKMASPN